MSDEPRRVAPDGLYTPEIKRHSLEKIRLHNRYSSIFATAMRTKWDNLGYIGLYAGAGHARVADTGEVVETSALAVLRQPHPFTDYVYVDANPLCAQALETRAQAVQGAARVTILPADVNTSAEAVKRALPRFSKSRTLLSFCFVDPFTLELQFSTIRALSTLQMDFLVLLMLGVDGRRNFQSYLSNPASTRIDELIDCPTWRAEYTHGRNVIHFLVNKFDAAMQGLGYLSAAQDVHPVKIAGMGVLQYVLAYYSKNELGLKFWRETRSSLSSQLSLGW